MSSAKRVYLDYRIPKNSGRDTLPGGLSTPGQVDVNPKS